MALLFGIYLLDTTVSTLTAFIGLFLLIFGLIGLWHGYFLLSCTTLKGTAMSRSGRAIRLREVLQEAQELAEMVHFDQQEQLLELETSTQQYEALEQRIQKAREQLSDLQNLEKLLPEHAYATFRLWQGFITRSNRSNLLWGIGLFLTGLILSPVAQAVYEKLTS
ncbi:hypothetical protein [Microtetraspora malaysiensis]|uniref:SMODS and SLOG-associating 2TM effector domain-containing protein n=1 Tax=Microtetraspora malaysiensis TaxID=161358 RepID=A0ABW6T843_9ACTN